MSIHRRVEEMYPGPGSVFLVRLTERRQIRNYRDFTACDRARPHISPLERGANTVTRGP